MDTNLRTINPYNGINFANTDELLEYLDNSHDTYVASEMFGSMDSSDRALHVAHYRGIRKAIKEIKGKNSLNREKARKTA